MGKRPRLPVGQSLSEASPRASPKTVNEPYTRPSIRGWLLPVLIGPFLTVYTAVTATAALRGDVGLIGRGVSWALGMLFGTGWAFVYVLLLVATDLALLTLKFRTLAVGWRGWLTSIGSALAVHFVYQMAPPYTFYKLGFWGIAAAVLVPMVLAVVGFRIFAGVKPPRA